MCSTKIRQSAFGGFFEEEKDWEFSSNIHVNATPLTSGRAAIRQILKVTKAKQVYLPFYICDTVINTLKETEVCFEFYQLSSEFEPINLPPLKSGTFLFYVNYFGLHGHVAEKLLSKYKGQLIVDNTQAFFEQPHADYWSFNSARKFFGVPDGAYLYAPVTMEKPKSFNKRILTKHLIERAQGNIQDGYALFLENEKRVTSTYLGMSSYTQKTLEKLNHTKIKKIRKANFRIYQKAFSGINHIHLPLTTGMKNNATPFCYPLLPNSSIEKKRLADQNIFIATLWPDVLTREGKQFAFEKNLSERLICLPVDHRYSESECEYISTKVLDLLKVKKNLEGSSHA